MQDKSKVSHAILDVESRHDKAAKIIAALSKYTDIASANVLDIGTGAGVIASDIAAKAKSVTSVDMHDERKVTDGFRFTQVDGVQLPFPDASFDVVVYNHVIEHVPEQQEHIKEIARVLRSEGLLYLATPNKFGPLDPHYRVPFISWLPRPAAAGYLRLLKRKTWDIHPVSPWRLQRLTRGRFTGKNLTADIIKRPADYDMPASRGVKLLGLLPLGALRTLQPFVPTQIHIFKRL